MSSGALARSQLAVAIAVTIALAPSDPRWAALSRALLALVQSLAWPVRVNAVRTGRRRATELVSRALDSVAELAQQRIADGVAVARATRVMERASAAREALDALASVSADRAA